MVVFFRKSVVVPAEFPGSGCSMHHTRSAGTIVSTFMGLAILRKDSFSRRQTLLVLIEQMSIRSPKKDTTRGNLGVLPDTVRSSSDSREDDKEEEEEEGEEDTP